MPSWYLLLTLLAVGGFGLFFGVGLGRWLHTQKAEQELGDSGHPWLEKGVLFLGLLVVVGLLIFGGQSGQGLLTLMAIVYVIASLGGLAIWMSLPPTTLFGWGLRLRPKQTIRGFWEIRHSLEAPQARDIIRQILASRRGRKAADQVLGDHELYQPHQRQRSLEKLFGLRPARPQTFDIGQAEKLRRAYQVLGVSPDSTLEEIKQRYRSLVRQHHPDRPDVDEEETLRKILRAWETIQQARENPKR